MSERARVCAFAAVFGACLAVAAGYLVFSVARADSGSVARASEARIERVTAEPYLVFLASRSGRKPFDQLAIAPAATPSDRVFTGLRCDRVSMTRNGGACVRHTTKIATTYDITYLDARFGETSSYAGFGIPSRARLSPSGRLVGVTSFVAGHSYGEPGAFSTRASIFRAGEDEPVVNTLEELHVLRDGRRFEPEGRNFWGITFDDEETFFATMGTGRRTFLVRGSLATRRIETVSENAECPSLSPDGKRVAYKHRGAGGRWRFAVLDLASGRETLLAETRSIDDQLAWADGGTLLYSDGTDVWRVRADARGVPRRVLAGATSPMLVR